jgi:hypothetical protein
MGQHVRILPRRGFVKQQREAIQDAKASHMMYSQEISPPQETRNEELLSVRIIDRGREARVFDGVARRGSKSFLKSHTLFNQRIGVSEKFIYVHLLPSLLRRENPAFLLPVARALETIGGTNVLPVTEALFDLRSVYFKLKKHLSTEEKRYLRDWTEIKRRKRIGFDVDTLLAKRRGGEPLPESILTSIEARIAEITEEQFLELIAPGHIKQYVGRDLAASASFLKTVYLHLMRQGSSQPLEPNIVVLIDLVGPMGEPLENVTSWLLRDGPDLGVTIWLHGSLTVIPKALLTQFSNVVLFRPSPAEICLLSEVLPAATEDLGQLEYHQRILAYGPCVGRGEWRILEPQHFWRN